MIIGILGTGRIARNLGDHWAKANHTVCFGSRTPQKAMDLAESVGFDSQGGSYKEASESAEILLLSIPWYAAQDTLNQCGNLEGKILIDCINPLAEDWKSLSLGFDRSAAEEIAKQHPKAHVVKAFNTISDKVIKNGACFGHQPSTAFYCGDDPLSKEKVKTLISDIGFEPIDCGNLAIARYLEPMACLFINIAIQGYGADIAFKLLQRQTDQ
jgi:hypothetical protein